MFISADRYKKKKNEWHKVALYEGIYEKIGDIESNSSFILEEKSDF